MAKWQSQSYLWKYAIILCVIQGVTRVTSWPQLISNLLVAPACFQCCFWLALHFFTPQVFLFSIQFTEYITCKLVSNHVHRLFQDILVCVLYFSHWYIVVVCAAQAKDLFCVCRLDVVFNFRDIKPQSHFHTFMCCQIRCWKNMERRC